MPDPLGNFSFTWPLYAAFLVAYLLGSIPFGLLLTRLAGAGDLRQVGSGNIGATNVLRTGRKGLAALTLLFDAGKGAAAVAVADHWFGPSMAVFAALGVIAGHVAPVWLRFRGGKGVATTFGVLWVFSWPVGVAAAAIWLAMALLFRYSSLAAILAIGSSPAWAWALTGVAEAEVTGLIAVAVVARHAGNIRRLLKGEESRIRFR
ncbi:MAG: glycerol-3-phosphate 1-O-acyltransferase PlsY [Alphaproteobacteria bacterium]|nr:glycerol-3-phosphate 1-O-acyltransferase PlsY [Alphaproteobacteria bacterium]MCY4319670.1 glycerol-3-phosphate 1-O-acyltransferase PlsY [Alphaproteobacteria bacterium]